MGVDKTLKTFGIKVIARVTKEQQIIISDNVATKISNEFNYIDYGYVYKKLMIAKMYIAQIPEGLSRAIYMYEEDTLYISDEEDINNISEELMHECIHTIQDIRDKKGNVKQLGQCIFSEFKVYAMALNEASIQYIISKMYDKEIEFAQAYGIKAKTYSTNRYPLICNIILQLLYIASPEKLVTSTIYSKDSFIIDCIESLGGELSFTNIQSNLDDMLYASEKITGLKRDAKKGELEDAEKIVKQIYEQEELIRRLYMDCQMSIFTMYFDRLYGNLETTEDIEYYKKKLEGYEDLFGTFVNKDEEYFSRYYQNYCAGKFEKLKEMELEIEKRNNLALTVVSENVIEQLFKKIKKLFLKVKNRM